MRGVVPAESPAVVAGRGAQGAGRRRAHLRDHDVASGGDGFDQYADTRSQVYGGVAAETAVDQRRRSPRPRGQVVTYDGAAGRHLLLLDLRRAHRERRELVRSAPSRKPWLKSRRRPVRRRLAQAPLGPDPDDADAGRRASCAALVKGRFSGIKVVAARRARRGSCARRRRRHRAGARASTGPQLRARFGLFDTWAYFTSITTREEPPPDADAGDRRPTGGARRRSARAARRAARRVAGRVLPARAGAAVHVQRRDARPLGRRSARRALRRGGRYRAAVAGAGRLPRALPRRRRPGRPRPADDGERCRTRASTCVAAESAAQRRPARRPALVDGAGLGRGARSAAAARASAAATSTRCSRPSSEELQPVPGIAAALDAITLPSCVASSASVEKMRFTLGHTGLWDRFEGRISAPPRSSTASRRPTSSCTRRRRWAGSRRLRRGGGLAARASRRRCAPG